MENKSILDQIIINNQAEEVSRLDVVELINNLFNKLNNRERDVLTKRFGLFGNCKETLEKIGQIHKLTRERIRQIETASIKKIRQLEDSNKDISGLKKVINQLLEAHGGLMEKEYMLDNLVNISTGAYQTKSKDIDIHRRHFNFLISKFLFNEFEEIKKSKYFKNLFKLKHQSLEHLEVLVEELLEKINELKSTMTIEGLVKLTKGLASYKKNEEKFEISNNLSSEKIVHSFLKTIKNIGQNRFGKWGISNWREINPKTVNDKIYLILKNQGKPMHFVEIADKINQVIFDKKQANAATVHNELILDNKYVLVGRGLYGLKEWGYCKGAVIDVVKNILEQSNLPLSRDEIIAKVLEQRFVREATINLALMDKKRFERLKDGKYQLKQVK
ncbi:MAG: sigma factor-like helix-turn-helix DNA-binding protein [bacterium]|nr:sigma factor-like helix-turn-helix DNA-binding protein [bacterium]